jgi:hypothetical protein
VALVAFRVFLRNESSRQATLNEAGVRAKRSGKVKCTHREGKNKEKRTNNNNPTQNRSQNNTTQTAKS